jgi:prevent-host-death family protein
MDTGHVKITATDFKAKCLQLLDQVQRTGADLVITKRGRSVARLVPMAEEQPWKSLRGQGHFVGDPFSPALSESEIQALK